VTDPQRLVRVILQACGLGMGVLCLGCGLLDNLAETLDGCTSAPVTLVNSQQTLEAVHLVGPDEIVGEGNRLTSGASRQIWLCLGEGRSYAFQAVNDAGVVVGSAKCASGQDEYPGIEVRVVWTPVGLRCENW
jgi:hypothetical protein